LYRPKFQATLLKSLCELILDERSWTGWHG
jgi:hypothetical protein